MYLDSDFIETASMKGIKPTLFSPDPAAFMTGIGEAKELFFDALDGVWKRFGIREFLEGSVAEKQFIKTQRKSNSIFPLGLSRQEPPSKRPRIETTTSAGMTLRGCVWHLSPTSVRHTLKL